MIPAAPQPGSEPDPLGGLPPGAGRLNVLLTEDREHPEEHWTRQVPRMLAPLGVHAEVAGCGQEALDLAATMPFHAVVVDLDTPRRRGQAGALPVTDGLWLLKVLGRGGAGGAAPPLIAVNGRLAAGQAERVLAEALKLGVFSVISRPVRLPTVLATIQRLIERRYGNRWPVQPPPSA